MKFEKLTHFARGFVYAYNGIRAAVQEERNFRFHLCAALYAFVAAYWAQLPAVETALIALCVAAVLALENASGGQMAVLTVPTLDGEPIPGSGETIQAADCLEVVELMRGQTPFTASRAPRDYMTEVLSGIEGGPTQPLPEDAAAAAAEFLTRLARHGLIEFLPDEIGRAHV